MLHGQKASKEGLDAATKGGFASLVPQDAASHAAFTAPAEALTDREHQHAVDDSDDALDKSDWAGNMRLLLMCFVGSGFFTLMTYFFPILRNLPVFGSVAAHTWLWSFNPSLAYVGQGIIMGTETTLHMMLGAVVGWGILSPLAKSRGWAPGDVDDWERGSKGWIIWISLAIMLVDGVVSLAYVAFRPVLSTDLSAVVSSLRQSVDEHGIKGLWQKPSHNYSLLLNDEAGPTSYTYETMARNHSSEPLQDHDDAPPEERISNTFVSVSLVASIALCILTIHLVFGDLVPLYATTVAVFMALVLSIMGVRALGETDLNPVSGISKLAQLFFAVIIPQSHKSSVLINLIAGAVSEAGALQAGDLMQDLKTGHLLGAAPKAQFWGQVIGATGGALLSAFIYRVYTRFVHLHTP